MNDIIQKASVQDGLNPVSEVLESNQALLNLVPEADSLNCFHSIFGTDLGLSQYDLSQTTWDDGLNDHNITINDLKNEPKLGYRVHYEKNDATALELKPEEYFDKSLCRKRLKCPSCYFLSDHHGNLTQHMKVHEKLEYNTLYQCEYCSFQTRYKNSIKGHLSRHEENSKRPRKRRGKGRKWNQIHKVQ